MTGDGDVESNPGPLPQCAECPLNHWGLIIGIVLIVLGFLGFDSWILRKRLALLRAGDVESNPGPLDCSRCTDANIFLDRDVPQILLVFIIIFLMHIVVYATLMSLCEYRRTGKFLGGTFDTSNSKSDKSDNVASKNGAVTLPDLVKNSRPSVKPPRTNELTPQKGRSFLLTALILLGLTTPSRGMLRTISPSGMLPVTGIRAHTPVKLCQIISPNIQKDEIRKIHNEFVSISWTTTDKTFIIPDMITMPNTTLPNDRLICTNARGTQIGAFFPVFNQSSLLNLHITRTSATLETYFTFYYKWGVKLENTNMTVKEGRLHRRKIPLPREFPSISIPYKVTYYTTFLNQNTAISREQDTVLISHDFLQNSWQTRTKTSVTQIIELRQDWKIQDTVRLQTGQLLSTNYLESNRDLWECSKTPFSRTLRKTIIPIQASMFDVKLQIRPVKGIATKRLTLVDQDGGTKVEDDKKFWLRTLAYYRMIQQKDAAKLKTQKVYDKYQEIKSEFNTCTTSKTLPTWYDCGLPFWVNWIKQKNRAQIRQMFIIPDKGNLGRSTALGTALWPRDESYLFYHVSKNQKPCQECNKTDDWEIANELQGFEGYPLKQYNAMSTPAGATVAVGKHEVITPRLSTAIRIQLNQSTNVIYYIWADSRTKVQWTNLQLEEYVTRTIQVIYPDISDKTRKQAAHEITRTRHVTRIAQIARMTHQDPWTMSLLLNSPTPYTRGWFKYKKKRENNQVPEQYFTIL